jgi:uncharacterized protein YjdB
MRVSRLVFWLVPVLLSASCSQKPAAIDISPKEVKIYGLERSQRLTGRVLDRAGQPLEQGGTPSWSSSNPEVVTAEAGGRLVAKKEGKATVTAEYAGIRAQVPVEVVDVSTVEVSPLVAPLTGPVGTRFPLTATIKNSRQEPVSMAPAWTSLDPKVATVSSDGLVTSVGPGTTTVLAKIGDLQAAAEIQVSLREIARLELRPETALVRVGDSQRFQVTAYGPDGAAIPDVVAVFRSSNPTVATVDSSGTASGLAVGTAIIRAELAGASAESTLLVN